MFDSGASEDSAYVLEEEISSLLSKGAIRVILGEEIQEGFYSRYFMFPKKGRSVPHFGHPYFERLSQKIQAHDSHNQGVVSSIQPGDWFTSIDLQETYQGTAHEYMKLPFRRSLVFTKCVEAALNPLGDSGLSIHSYIIDYLLCLHTEALSARDTSTPLTHLTNLVSE